MDILINNAGIGDFVSFPEISSEKWDRMINIHLKGSFNCCQAALGAMKARSYGKIVNVSSVAGKRGDFIGNAHYTAAKAGIIGLTKSLALYAAPFGINVNAIAPGLVATELSDEMSPEMKATTLSRIPAGRLGRPEEIAPGRRLSRVGRRKLHLRRNIKCQRRLLHGLMPISVVLLRIFK